MSAPQARPDMDLLARKGRAAPVGAVSDAAPAPGLDSESLPEIGATAQAAAAPPASLLPLVLTGRCNTRDAALLPRDPPQEASVPAAKPAPTGTEVPDTSAKSESPRPDPALLLTLRPALGSEPRRFPALAAGLALALVLGAAGYGYQSGWFLSRQPERLQEPAEASPAAVTESPPAAPPATNFGPPSVDVVTIESDGAAVIAGRAAPGLELILLDNGTPIGTVTADARGEWVFIPASPLPGGAHDIGLVIKEVRGGVSVPAAEKVPSIPGVSTLKEVP